MQIRGIKSPFLYRTQTWRLFLPYYRIALSFWSLNLIWFLAEQMVGPLCCLPPPVV